MSNVIPFLSGLTPSIIAEDEVTIPRLSSVLDAAFIDHEIDEDSDIYVTDGVDFPLWIDLLSDRKLVNLFTYLPLDDQREANWLTRVNDMNSKDKAAAVLLLQGLRLGGLLDDVRGRPRGAEFAERSLSRCRPR